MSAPPAEAADDNDGEDDDQYGMDRFTAFLAQRRAEVNAQNAQQARGTYVPPARADDDDDAEDDEDEDDAPLDQIADDDAEDDAVPHILWAQAAAIQPNAAAPPPFRRGDVTYAPDVAALKGDHLRNLTLQTDMPHITHLAQLGFVKETRQLHRRMLRQIAAMPERLSQLPLATAIIAQLTEEGRTRN